jgi:hypothetical protein
VQKEVRALQEAAGKRRSQDPTPPAALPKGPRPAVGLDLQSNDAFHTLIQWLHGKLVRRLIADNPSLLPSDV